MIFSLCTFSQCMKKKIKIQENTKIKLMRKREKTIKIISPAPNFLENYILKNCVLV